VVVQIMSIKYVKLGKRCLDIWMCV